MKIPIIAVVGATAVGKTDLSIKLAKDFNGEVISIDSVQIYKKFDIGSAKITLEEMEGIEHHLIDILDPREQFSVYDFQKLAREKIKEIYNKGKLPILIGGSGYYMNAVLYDYKFVEHVEKEENIPLQEMLDFLKNTYPDTYNALDIYNERRVINAYNYVKSSGQTTQNNKDGDKIFKDYNPHIIVLDRPREILYERINKRVGLMLEKGLIREVMEIEREYGRNLQAFTSIGYKETLDFIDGHISEGKLCESISQNSRRYAKKQLTWFRNKIVDKIWYDLEKVEYKQIKEDIIKFLGK